jgi:tetratricopeptide (TPR) repeat protein
VRPAVAGLLLAACGVVGQAVPAVRAADGPAPTHAPADAKALHVRALEHAEAGRLEAALADVDAALEHSPDAALTLGLKGNILMRMERFEDAVAAFSRSLAIQPLAQVHFDRGFCHFNLGGFARAIEDYTAAYRLDARLNGLLYERGLAYLKTGDVRRAMNDLERARTQTPDDPRAALLLSWIYATAPDDAVRDGRKALVLAGELCDPVTCQTTEPLNVLAAPPDVLGGNYLQVQTLLLDCTLARSGTVIHADLDGLPLSITSDNAGQVRERLEDRTRIYAEAIRRRGFAQLAAGYRPQAAGGCDEWGLSEEPWLVEQDGFEAHFTQGDVRHMGVVVESAVVFRHDMNADIILSGVIEDGTIVITTPQRYGITGTAHERCTLTLTPENVAGPEWAKAFAGRALARRSYEEIAPAVADLDRAIELAPSPAILALHASALASWPDEKVRDGRRAVVSAKRALELSGATPDANVLAAAAAASAEAGDFDGAVSYQRRATALASEEVRPLFQERLQLFESRRPFHEEPAHPDQ